MHRIAVTSSFVRGALLVTITVAAGVLPASAAAAGCEVLQDPADRVECQARAEARAAAREEVERQLEGATSTSADDQPASRGPSARSAAWQDAVDEADGFDPGAVLEPRPLAAVGGLLWFFLAVRARRRARTRAART